MVDNTWLYSSVAFISACYCFYLLRNLRLKNASTAFLLLFGNLTLMNLAQGSGYLIWNSRPEVAEYFADAYLISLYFFFTHLVIFAFGLSKTRLKSLHWAALYSYPTMLTCFHFFGLMVESYRVEQNSLMHNDGLMAPLFDFHLLAFCVFSIVIFIRNVKAHRGDKMFVSKNLIALSAFIPITLVFFIIIALSRTDHAIAIGLIGPTITIYTAYTYYYLSRERVVDLSIGVAFFYDRLKLAYLLLETHKSKADLKHFHKEVERQFIIEALRENNHNIYDTADKLGFNHTTLRNKIKEYEIDLSPTLKAGRALT